MITYCCFQKAEYIHKIKSTRRKKPLVLPLLTYNIRRMRTEMENWRFAAVKYRDTLCEI